MAIGGEGNYFVGGNWFVRELATIVTSTAGVTWVQRQPGNRQTQAGLTGVVYGNGHFVAIGPQGLILQSASIITLAISPTVDTGLLKLSLEGLQANFSATRRAASLLGGGVVARSLQIHFGICSSLAPTSAQNPLPQMYSYFGDTTQHHRASGFRGLKRESL